MYIKTTWINDSEPYIEADNLNKIEDALETAYNKTTLHDRELANVEAVLDIDNMAIQNNGKVYDLIDGTNNYSCGLIDTTYTTTTSAYSAEETEIEVADASDFEVGQEVTIYDDVNKEDVIISDITDNTLTISALENNYKINAAVCRSNVIYNTTDNQLDFKGWDTSVEYDVSTPTTVVASAYDTSGNGGRKLVRLSNGWLVCATWDVTNTRIRFFKSDDNGVTFNQLCWYGGTQDKGIALCSIGTTVYCYTTGGYPNSHLIKFDATTVSNASSLSAFSTVDSGQTNPFGVGCSIAADSNGYLYACWTSKNSTYPNSFNIRYSKSTDGGATWAAPTQITTVTLSTQNCVRPCIAIKGDNTPIIFYEFDNDGNNESFIKKCSYSSGWHQSTIYDGSGYYQSNPSAVVSPDGTIHVAWDGFDSTDTTRNNIRYSKSTDNGVTWSSAIKLTTGNTYYQGKPSISADKNNNIYIIWGGQVDSSWYQIRKIVYTTSWGSITNLTTGASNKADPACCSNYTDFTDPLTIYKSTQDALVGFRGIFSAEGTTELTHAVARYNIIPPMGELTETALWVQHERPTPDDDYVVTASLSIVDTSANESYTAMTKTTTNLSDSIAEEQFLGSVVTAQEKGTLKIEIVRDSVSNNKLGTDGNCESADVVGNNWQSTVALDSTTKVFSTNSLKMTQTSGIDANTKFDIASRIDTSKYYLMSAYVKNGDATSIYLRYQSDGVPTVVSSTIADTSWTRVGIKVQPSDMSTNSRLSVCINGSAGQYANFDGVLIREITEDEYSLTVNELLDKYNFVGDEIDSAITKILGAIA